METKGHTYSSANQWEQGIGVRNESSQGICDIFGHQGKRYVLHKANTSHHPKNIIPTVKRGCGSIML